MLIQFLDIFLLCSKSHVLYRFIGIQNLGLQTSKNPYQARNELAKEKGDFEEEKAKVWAQFMQEKQKEYWNRTNRLFLGLFHHGVFCLSLFKHCRRIHKSPTKYKGTNSSKSRSEKTSRKSPPPSSKSRLKGKTPGRRLSRKGKKSKMRRNKAGDSSLWRGNDYDRRL